MSDANKYYSFYNDTEDLRRFGRKEMADQFRTTRDWLRRAGCEARDAVVLEAGCGMGALAAVHAGHVGLDYSLVGLKQFAAPSAKRINGDMQALPFRSAACDFLFSWTALEHVPKPEEALAEVERVLKPGGVALLAPAWNVRPWAAKGLPVRAYRELSWLDKLAKALIPLRNSLVWRGLFAIPRRLARELRARLLSRPLPFDYKRLTPNLEEYVYTDCDAFVSMDPHAAILYFQSRGWDVLSHPTILSRLLSRFEPVVVRKPREHARRGRRTAVETPNDVAG